MPEILAETTNTPPDNLYREILECLGTELGIDAKQITPESRLYQDLGIDGLEAAHFMTIFSRNFSVDMGSFDISKHFGPELPFMPLLWLYWRIFKSSNLNEKGQVKMIPIRVADLYSAAKLRVWIDLSQRVPE